VTQNLALLPVDLPNTIKMDNAKIAVRFWQIATNATEQLVLVVEIIKFFQATQNPVLLLVVQLNTTKMEFAQIVTHS